MPDKSNTTVKPVVATTTTPTAANTESNVMENSSTSIPDSAKYSKPAYIKKKKKKKICLLCKKGCVSINYRDVTLLKNYLKKYNKILSHKISGNCLKHQHQIASSIKRARFVGLLPFVSP